MEDRDIRYYQRRSIRIGQQYIHRIHFTTSAIESNTVVIRSLFF
jgi:hypothetical protein